MKNWFSEHKRSIIVSILLTLLPMVIGCVLWDRLPDNMSIHWGADGAADGTGTKALAVFTLPAILTALNLVCLLVTAADPKQAGQSKKALGMIFWIMPLISLVACGIVYAASLGYAWNVFLLIPALLGVLFVVIGNYMPKVKQNSTLGIKISWTLRNEENWNKTHRFAGKLWVAGGIVTLLTMLLPLKWMIGMLLAVILLTTVPPVIYSYCIYKAHKAQGLEYAALPKTPAEKKRSVISVILVIAILAGVALLMFTGNITCTCADDALRIEASFAENLTVPYADMDEVVFRENFDIGARVLGFYSARLSTGSFQNEELRDYTLYAYNACPSMVLIRSGSKWLALNAETPEQTQALYETLLEKIK